MPSPETCLYFVSSQKLTSDESLALWTYKLVFSEDDRLKVPAGDQRPQPIWGILPPDGYVPDKFIDYSGMADPVLVNQVAAEAFYYCRHMKYEKDGKEFDQKSRLCRYAQGIREPIYATQDVNGVEFAMTFWFIATAMESQQDCYIWGPRTASDDEGIFIPVQFTLTMPAGAVANKK